MRRGAVMALTGRAGHRLWVVSVHLGLSGRERISHARALTDLLATRDPAIVGGDLNEDAAGEAALWIAKRYWDAAAESAEAATFPASEPRSRIDFVFVSQGIRVQRTWTGDARFVGLSDHLPVMVDLALGED